jgi:serine/threonine protein kinase
MVWMSGQQIFNGYYTIEGVLGSGGFGITYRATNPRGEREVVKTLQDHILQSPSWAQHRDSLRQRFYDEANLLLKLHDAPQGNPLLRHIVKGNNLFREDGFPCFAMEYIDGESLADRLELGGIPEADAVRWIEQVGRSLEWVHQQGIVHRDIKPANIVLRSDGSAVLIDFGIARESTLGLELQNLTVMASEGYAAPEQYEGKAKPFTDVYGLAATLYALLAGQVPQGALLRLQKDGLKPLRELCPGVSDRVCEAVMEGLRLDGRLRAQSVGQWLGRLLGEEMTLPPKALPIYSSTESQQKNKTYATKLASQHSADAIAFSPDGRILVTACDDTPDTVMVWDLLRGKQVYGLQCHELIELFDKAGYLNECEAPSFLWGTPKLSFSLDAKAFNYLGCVWGIECEKVTYVKPIQPKLDSHYEHCAITCNAEIAISHVSKKNADLWHTKDMSILHNLKFEDNLWHAYSHQFSPNNSIVGCIAVYEVSPDVLPKSPWKEVLHFWSVATGEKLCDLMLPINIRAENKQTGIFTFSSDNQMIASNCGDDNRGSILISDLATGKHLCQFQGSRKERVSNALGFLGCNHIESLAFSPNNQLLACGDSLGNITIWHLKEDFWGKLTAKKKTSFT